MGRLLKIAVVTTVLGLAPAAGAAAADAGHGQAIFRQQCSTRHSPSRGVNGVGPSLFGVVGRAPGAVSGFHYSTAMKADGVAWSADRLKAYIGAPSHVVPGNHMPYGGLHNAGQLDDLITYLTTLR